MIGCWSTVAAAGAGAVVVVVVLVAVAVAPVVVVLVGFAEPVAAVEYAIQCRFDERNSVRIAELAADLAIAPKRYLLG